MNDARDFFFANYSSKTCVSYEQIMAPIFYGAQPNNTRHISLPSNAYKKSFNKSFTKQIQVVSRTMLN